MKLVLNQPGLEPFEPEMDLKVLIACEGSTHAQQACALLERVGRQGQAQGRLIYSWWNFDLLTIGALRRQAGWEAAAADVIVIAAHDGPQLPETVIDWISEWLAAREYRAKALVALLDTDVVKPVRKRAAHGILSQLKKVAEMGQMNFFANQGGGVGKWEAEALLAGVTGQSPGNPAGQTKVCASRIAGWAGRVPAEMHLRLDQLGKHTNTLAHL